MSNINRSKDEGKAVIAKTNNGKYIEATFERVSSTVNNTNLYNVLCLINSLMIGNNPNYYIVERYNLMSTSQTYPEKTGGNYKDIARNLYTSAGEIYNVDFINVKTSATDTEVYNTMTAFSEIAYNSLLGMKRLCILQLPIVNSQ